MLVDFGLQAKETWAPAEEGRQLGIPQREIAPAGDGWGPGRAVRGAGSLALAGSARACGRRGRRGEDDLDKTPLRERRQPDP